MRQAWNNVLSAWINVGSENAVLLGLVMLFPPLFDHIPFAQQLPVHTPLFLPYPLRSAAELRLDAFHPYPVRSCGDAAEFIVP